MGASSRCPPEHAVSDSTAINLDIKFYGENTKVAIKKDRTTQEVFVEPLSATRISTRMIFFYKSCARCRTRNFDTLTDSTPINYTSYWIYAPTLLQQRGFIHHQI